MHLIDLLEVEAQLVLGAVLVARLGRASADQQHKQSQDQQHNSVNI